MPVCFYLVHNLTTRNCNKEVMYTMMPRVTTYSKSACIKLVHAMMPRENIDQREASKVKTGAKIFKYLNLTLINMPYSSKSEPRSSRGKQQVNEDDIKQRSQSWRKVSNYPWKFLQLQPFVGNSNWKSCLSGRQYSSKLKATSPAIQMKLEDIQ